MEPNSTPDIATIEARLVEVCERLVGAARGEVAAELFDQLFDTPVSDRVLAAIIGIDEFEWQCIAEGVSGIDLPTQFITPLHALGARLRARFGGQG